MNFAKIAMTILITGFIISLVAVAMYAANLLSEGNLFGIAPLVAVAAFSYGGITVLKESRATN